MTKPYPLSYRGGVPHLAVPAEQAPALLAYLRQLHRPYVAAPAGDRTDVAFPHTPVSVVYRLLDDFVATSLAS